MSYIYSRIMSLQGKILNISFYDLLNPFSRCDYKTKLKTHLLLHYLLRIKEISTSTIEKINQPLIESDESKLIEILHLRYKNLKSTTNRLKLDKETDCILVEKQFKKLLFEKPFCYTYYLYCLFSSKQSFKPQIFSLFLHLIIPFTYFDFFRNVHLKCSVSGDCELSIS